MFGIWTTVAEGVTGSRSAWLKDDGKVVTFETMAEAEAYADTLTASRTLKGGTTPSGSPIAYQYYRAAQLTGNSE